MTYQFGDCVVDFASRTLTHRGERVPLSPKAFQLFTALFEARPEVLSKDALMTRLWPDVFVVEGNLAVLVGELREAVGDDAREQRTIRTHARIGYSFVATATRTAGIEPTSSPAFLVSDGERFALSRGVNIVGRGIDCDVRLSDPTVSKHHARIVLQEQATTIEDLGSKNGTCVGDVPLTDKPGRLIDGDVIAFGAVLATFAVASLESSSTLTLT